ncbi:MAG: biotin/lipoyl-binding protein [Anaerolineales bacterium]|nr:biotin/lipoyl-binding protein [Anaerolineales bacterium]
MKYNVTIKNKSHVVEIEDINARPVIAYVDGQRFEVIPDTNPIGSENQAKVKKEPLEVHSFDLRKPVASLNPNELTAPLPGTVIEVFVKPGDVIEAGQVIVIIEAMKMKNSIRSTRAGKITEVCVNTMQTVAHKQMLVKFEA